MYMYVTITYYLIYFTDQTNSNLKISQIKHFKIILKKRDKIK